MNMKEKKEILKIEHLAISFTQYDRGLRQITLPVISDLNVSVNAGEIVAIIGSSGSGKSLLAHSVLGLLPPNATVQGRIVFNGQELDEDGIKRLRGNAISLVPQGVSYLDPLMKSGAQVRWNKKDQNSKKRQRKLFDHYGLDHRTDDLFPFELSGGMARRVLLCSAMMEEPKLIIADEPTPGLHLEMAKKVMEDFRQLADEGHGVLLITHDVELALEVADRIVVFYAGMTVEEALASDFLREELLRHPYTKAMWRALPQNGFQTLKGSQPYVKEKPEGCPFGPRCACFTKECMGEIPISYIRGGNGKMYTCLPGGNGRRFV